MTILFIYYYFFTQVHQTITCVSMDGTCIIIGGTWDSRRQYYEPNAQMVLCAFLGATQFMWWGTKLWHPKNCICMGHGYQSITSNSCVGVKGCYYLWRWLSHHLQNSPRPTWGFFTRFLPIYWLDTICIDDFIAWLEKTPIHIEHECAHDATHLPLF